MLGSGKLNERIEIQRAEMVQTPSGGFEAVLSTVLDTFASVTHKKVSADVIATQTQLIEVFEFVIRHREDVEIRVADSIKWRGREFEIMGLPYTDRSTITIVAKAINNTTSNG